LYTSEQNTAYTDFEAAEGVYDEIRKRDPYRIDDIDVFSNILYVMEKRTKLSKLAHEFLALDKDRPEVCCLVGELALFGLGFAMRCDAWPSPTTGNHYSLRSEHEKAVKYFRRAVQLDRTFLSAWTLMGHEFIEMKNSQAAVEAYRRAVGECADTHVKDRYVITPPHQLARRKQEGLQRVVRAWPGIRAAKHAQLCIALLPARCGTSTVRRSHVAGNGDVLPRS